MLKPKKIRKSCRVLEVRKLTESTAVVRFEREGLDFEPGQYIRVGIEGDAEIRDYSVYSGADADYLEVMVRRVEDGLVSKDLCDIEVGVSIPLKVILYTSGLRKLVELTLNFSMAHMNC